MAEDNKSKGDINFDYNTASSGLNMDNTPSQVPKGSLTYALNATLENFDSNSINYQNEPGNEFCLKFPKNYTLIGKHFIQERNKHLFFLANPLTKQSEIGYMNNNDCQYHTLVNDACLNFDINTPIPKIVHRITNCSTEIYWPDQNGRRYLVIDKIPYKLKPGSEICNSEYTDELDCNQISIQPKFAIPSIEVTDIRNGGSITAGTVQFALQYSDALGNPYTSYYSITNPTPIADPGLITVNFNYPVGKSVVVKLSNIETTGKFQYFNLAVIHTVNDITSVELVGTYFIEGPTKEVTYSGQNVANIRLTVNDIFEKMPTYGSADDITTVQDVLVWKGLSSEERVNYQSIASQIKLQWETYRIPPGEDYSDEMNATNLRSYLRDEIYPFEFVPILTSGKQNDGFHIPGRVISEIERGLPAVLNTNPDYIGDKDNLSEPYWKTYNTALRLDFSAGYSPAPDYKGPYEYGDFAYWESEEEYPCDKSIWGELAGQKIRHHKFPDVEVSPIFESKIFSTLSDMEMSNNAVFPIGVKIDVQQIKDLIRISKLTDAQKADIVGFKIVRGNRGTNKSIVAKGMLRNVNKYTREDQDFYYPNYPYNDLNEDPFINSRNNAWFGETSAWLVRGITSGKITIGDPNNNKPKDFPITAGILYEICSTYRPTTLGETQAEIGPADYDLIKVNATGCKGFRVNWIDPFSSTGETSTAKSEFLSVGFGGIDPTFHIIRVAVGDNGDYSSCTNSFLCDCVYSADRLEVVNQPPGVTGGGGRRSTMHCNENKPLTSVEDSPVKEELAHRQVFNSPETSFGQPFLGDILKLESVMYGKGKAHFVSVKDNAKYRLLTKEAQEDALKSSQAVGNITNPANAAAMFTVYQAYLTIYINGITKKNYGYSFNSRANYDYNVAVPDSLGIKQRRLDLKKYLIPVVQNVGEDDININNYQRETSVYLRTEEGVASLPFPHNSPKILAGPNITEYSRFTIGETGHCAIPAEEQDIRVVSYYASIKNTFPGQWGQIYSYETIDTGFQRNLYTDESPLATIFGGDTFINRFAYKTKIPFFIDNRVGAPDESDIFYDELGNIGYPKYWHSARSILKDYLVSGLGNMVNIISYKAHEFDCKNSQDVATSDPNRTYYDGYFYLFAYGVPNFYVESSYNVDLRQAFNNKEGEFWPHVSTGIPDNWLQESFVSIANDNTYNYNVTYSKQNKENYFSHLPADWKDKQCFTRFPFRAIYSDPETSEPNNRVNNWLTYRPMAFFDFPQTYGKLTSIDGIDNRQLLVRFENKTLLYNALYTTQTNTQGQVYLGQSLFSAQSPPLDFAETDLGYAGSQHKFLLKIPQGQVSIDAKRGQIFLFNGVNNFKDLSAPGSGMNRFFTDHLSFEILRYFPDKESIDSVTKEKTIISGVNIDNNFKDLGLHGVYDSKFDRVIITKLDYVPLRNDIKYDSATKEFYIEEIIAPATTTTTTTVCIRPTGLSQAILLEGFETKNTSPCGQYLNIITTASSLSEACALWSVLKSCICSFTANSTFYTPIEYSSLLIGNKLYASYGDTDCTNVASEGFHFFVNTTNSVNIYSTLCALTTITIVTVNSDGVITALDSCNYVPSTTTTTTTLACISWKYNFTLHDCVTCTQVGSGSISNNVQLVVGKWYVYDIYKAHITAYVSCSSVPTSAVFSLSTQQDTCAAVICP